MFEWYLITMLYVMVFIYVRNDGQGKVRSALAPLLALVLPLLIIWIIWDFRQTEKIVHGHKEVVFDEDLH